MWVEPQAKYCYAQLDRFFAELLKDLTQVVLVVPSPAQHQVSPTFSSRSQSRITSFLSDNDDDVADRKRCKRALLEDNLSPSAPPPQKRVRIVDNITDDDFPPASGSMMTFTEDVETDIFLSQDSHDGGVAEIPKRVAAGTAATSAVGTQSAIRPDNSTPVLQPRYLFNICGRCASRGNRVRLDGGITCKACPQLDAKDAPFCLRCEQFLRNLLPDGNYEKNHGTSQCPNKKWLRSLNASACCRICHLGSCITVPNCRRTLDEMSEFVLPCLLNNKALRHRARDKFKYCDPGKNIEGKQGEMGTVAQFLGWMGQDDTHGVSNFILLTEFLLKNMSWKKIKSYSGDSI